VAWDTSQNPALFFCSWKPNIDRELELRFEYKVMIDAEEAMVKQ